MKSKHTPACGIAAKYEAASRTFETVTGCGSMVGLQRCALRYRLIITLRNILLQKCPTQSRKELVSWMWKDRARKRPAALSTQHRLDDYGSIS